MTEGLTPRELSQEYAWDVVAVIVALVFGAMLVAL